MIIIIIILIKKFNKNISKLPLVTFIDVLLPLMDNLFGPTKKKS